MKRLLGGVAALALLGLFPFATGQEPGTGVPPGGGQGPQPGAPFFEKFDLNKDGKVDWEEYQKVKSGFAALDADGDGFITPVDFTKLMERQQQRMQQEMQRRILEHMERGGPGGFGPDREQGFRPRGREGERGREARPRRPERRPGMPGESRPGPMGPPDRPGREWRGRPEGGPDERGMPPRREGMERGSGDREHDGDEMEDEDEM